MPTVDSFFSSRGQVNWKAALSFSDLSPAVSAHIVRVFTFLAAMIGVAAAGVVAHSVLAIPSLFGTIGLFVSLMFFMTSQNESSRKMGALALAFSKGLVIAPLCEHALLVDPALITTAFLSCTVLFLSFALSAMYAQRRSYFFLSSLLASGLNMLLFMSLLSFFFHFEALFMLRIYGGLLLFAGYVLFDTQMMIEKACGGDYDVAGHAVDLFIDFVAIFVRILIILLKKEKKERR
ncbi:BAX inhibitor (BI)-1-like family protein [Andalucia godoyi]|uniref:BAX inhibitor (BI)-1-like family protein n=1 Tax=Andalucia godoyi TaxID=505711 RepID=A0A8K0F2U4_ANDGO|nr:BAX inhibitor (BI)-1-like family protein [Andalucia godoyi]|eukprot:ANDGO_00667.mRNA.1 BAX inhibitor (BI)-1-like family protein